MIDNKHFSIKAIIIGWLVDNVATFAFGFIIALVMAIMMGMSRGAGAVNTEQLAAKLDTLSKTTQFLIFQLTFGMMFTAIGGFVTAYLAKESEIKHSFAMGSLSLASGLLLSRVTGDTLPEWYMVSGILLSIPAAVLGGAVWLMMKKDFKS